MIQFAFAAFLLGGLGAAVPIVLHFLRSKPTLVAPFPDFMFLKRTIVEKHTRNKLRKWIILILRSLAFAFLAAAFAWPYLPNFAKAPDSATVVLWDNSFSMTAKPYYNEMKAKTLDILRRAGAKRPTLLGVISKGVVWYPKFTGKGGDLVAFLERSVPGEGAGGFENALREADARLEEMPAADKKIILVTDRQKLPWNDVDFSRELSPGIALKLVTPDKPGFANVAITSARVLGPFVVAKRKVAVSAEVANFSDGTRQFTIDVFMDSVKVTTWRGTLAAGETATPMFFLAPRELKPTAVSLRMHVADDIATDNRYYLAINPRPPPVIAITPLPGDCDFLGLALGAGAKTKLADIAPATSAGIRKADLVVLRGAPDAKARAAAKDVLQHGKNVVIVWSGTPEMRALLLSLGVASSTLTASDSECFGDIDFSHPFFKVFENTKISPLFQTRFYSHPKLGLPASALVAARFADGDPAVAVLPWGKGEVVIIASRLDRDATDWVIRPSFLPFIREVANYAMRSRNEHGDQYLVEEPVTAAGYTKVESIYDDHSKSDFKGVFVPEHSGAYLLEGNGKRKMIAVNPPPEESPSKLLPDGFKTNALVSKEPPPETDAKASVFSPEQGRTFWWILMVLAGAMIVSEMLIANRTAL